MALIPGTLPAGSKYPSDPQTLLETFAGYMTAPEAKKNRPTVSNYTSSAGGTVNVNAGGLDETIVLNNPGTYATFTLVFPSTSTSAVGQTLRFFTKDVVTALTVTLNGNTVLGPSLSAGTTAGQLLSWQKVDASVWIRLT